MRFFWPDACPATRANRVYNEQMDLGEAIAGCLGFSLTYKPVTFAALLTTLSRGQADIVISDIYATQDRAKAADFTSYSKVFDGALVAADANIGQVLRLTISCHL